MRYVRRVVVLAGLLAAPAAHAQMPPALPADVLSIEGIVSAFYDVISGPAGTPHQWRRDSTLYMPGAMFVSMDVKDGKPAASIVTPEQYRQATDKGFVKNGFFETEIGSNIERFGNVAQVRSVYETRRTPDGSLLGRGVNYLTLYWDGSRWWISAAVWDDERPDNPIRKEWIRPSGKVLQAKGTFDVKVAPVGTPEKTEAGTFGRMSLEKQFQGDLAGTGKGEMQTAGSDGGAAAYVTLEQVSGTLNGRRGTFVLMHNGNMTKESQNLTITVMPGSGTGQLAGIAGTFTITIVEGKHLYGFGYSLPTAP
jgi:hypothetical protein